ncbi:MAG: methionyl-tRNA formyltransferase [Thermomicrobiales bacterium]|nr:methionyl-tRNA formyltransferase [Thermomicrobiales bacterium]
MTTESIRTVFFGTPTYAVPALRALADDPRYDVVLVVTQPDRPAGRGRQLQQPPVKLAAERLGIEIYQPRSLRDASARQPLADADADLFVVAAYGLIFGPKTLALPRYGSLNLHASLLPAYRGASPVTAAILSGDAMTGVSLMVMESGLDTGPVVDRVSVPIAGTDTTESLTAKLAAAAAGLVVSSADRFVSGDVRPEPQDDQDATKVRQLVKADGWLDWEDSAAKLERTVRAMWPWPRAWTTFQGELLQVHQASTLTQPSDVPIGAIAFDGKEVAVACGEGALRLDVVQPAGGKPIPGAVWAAGRRVSTGERLGLEDAPETPPPMITRV